MTDSDTPKPQYIVFNETWYAEASKPYRRPTDEIGFGEFYLDGGCEWEANMAWYALQDSKPPSPKLEAFHDGSWRGIHKLGILAALADLEDDWITPRQFRDLLEGLGFTDATQRERDAR